MLSKAHLRYLVTWSAYVAMCACSVDRNPDTGFGMGTLERLDASDKQNLGASITYGTCNNNENTCFCFYGRPNELIFNGRPVSLSDFYFARRTGLHLFGHPDRPFLNPTADSLACSILGGRQLTLFVPMETSCSSWRGDYACVGGQLPTRPNGRNPLVDCGAHGSSDSSCTLRIQACTLDWGASPWIRYPGNIASYGYRFTTVRAAGSNGEPLSASIPVGYLGGVEDNMGPDASMSAVVATVCGQGTRFRWPPNTSCNTGTQEGNLDDMCRRLWRSCKGRPNPREGGAGSHLCPAMEAAGWN